jgi:D-3-phosphoglycerate dehydrogenase
MGEMRFKVVHVDSGISPPTEIERNELAKVGASLVLADCKSEEDIIAAAKDADGILSARRLITRNVMNSLEKCKVIARYGVGVDNIDIPAATDHGIAVANVPDYCMEEVANHSIMFLLACAKKLIPLNNAMKEGKWPRNLLKPMSCIYGETLGLVGFGRIAQAVASKAKVFGLNVIAYDPYMPEAKARELGVRLVTLDELVSESDYISVHPPLTKETHHMIGREQFRKMKKSAIIINVARGPVIDEEALIEALETGEIAGAGLDVFEKEPLDPDNRLLKLDCVALTPHSASYSEAAFAELRRRVAY